MLASPLRPLLLSCVATVGITSAASASDLSVSSLVGPGTIYAGAGAIAYFEVTNSGTPLAENYTAELVLSVDGVIDAGDLVVATVTNSILGWQSTLLNTPKGMSAGSYTFGIRVLPVVGETNPNNNELVGEAIDILQIELAVDDATPIDVMAHGNDVEVPVGPVIVRNDGSPTSVLVFTVAPTTPVPWLTVEPDSGFALGGVDSVEISITALPFGLPPGKYEVDLRIQNWLIADDFIDIPITLAVDEPAFVPGHRLFGSVSDETDVDLITVDGLEGEKLKLKLRTLTGDLSTQIELIDPDGLPEKTLVWKKSKKFVTRSLKLAKSGTYTLLLSGSDATTGDYEIKTGCSLPSKAKKRTLTLDNPGGGGEVSTPILLLSGATLSFTVNPNSKFEGPVGVTFTAPNGGVVNLQTMEVKPSGKLTVKGIVADQTGAYVVGISGFGDKTKASAKLTLKPIQPTKGGGDVLVP